MFNKIKGAGRGAARGLEDWLSELARRLLCRGLLSLLDAIRSLVKEGGEDLLIQEKEARLREVA